MDVGYDTPHDAVHAYGSWVRGALRTAGLNLPGGGIRIFRGIVLVGYAMISNFYKFDKNGR